MLLVADPGARIVSVMEPDVRWFHLDGRAERVATAFEGYDLLSARVVLTFATDSMGFFMFLGLADLLRI